MTKAGEPVLDKLTQPSIEHVLVIADGGAKSAYSFGRAIRV